MKKPFPLGLLLCAGLLPHTGSAAWQTSHTLASPDGALTLTLERDDTNGALAWSVVRSEAPLITRGALGIDLFTDDPTVETVTRVAIRESVVNRDSAILRQVGVRNGLAAILTPIDDAVTP